MNRSWKTLATLAAALLAPLASRGALAQEPDVRDIAPFVMLVVDSSGSMEDLPACECPDSKDGCLDCRPRCDLLNDAAGDPPKDTTTGHELKKNRWAVTLEALTGKFVDFECTSLPRLATNGMTYDVDYTIPYNQPWDCASPGDACPYSSSVRQLENGILDSYAETLRFGLMTFDGEYTYKGGDDLLDIDEYDTTLANGMSGMWSLGGKKPFKYPTCTDTYYVDSGARGPTATEGALVSLSSCATPPCNQYDLNKQIQETLLRTRPYGGTPIAASLTDLYDHLQNGVTDGYAACRKKYAILITDGTPDVDFRNYDCHCGDDDPSVSCGLNPDGTPRDPNEFNCPYPLAKDAARKLVAGDGTAANPKQLEKLFVLGMSVQDAAAKTVLDEIADAGNTTSALQADDPNTLRSTLDNVFSPLLNPISRSVPGFATGLTGIQYQISTGFQVSASSLSSTAPPWAGLIERRQFVCNPTTGLLETPDIEDEDRLHKVLNNQGSLRKLWTALPADPNPVKLARKLALGSGEGCDTSGCAMYEITDAAVSATVYDVADDTARRHVYEWMYGESSTPRRDRKLGDIYHSSPTLVGPPIDEPADDAYTRFRQLPVVRERPLVLYIATNDGVLHAMSVEDYPAAKYPLSFNDGHPILPIKAGEEFWGFIPPMLMPKLKDQLSSHQFNLDATPVVKDVYFKREGTADETEYRTVLIMGMRKGGKGYFALDVTDPVNPPKFLWQFTDDDMGLTYGQPEIMQATFLWPPESPTLQTRAVAILPGGVGVKGSGPGCDFGLTNSKRLPSGRPFASWTADDRAANQPKEHRPAVQCWERQGRSLYFVDVETGRQIKKVFDGDNDVGTGIWFPSPVTGTPTAYQDAVGTIADRGFVLDADGVLWRIDLSSADPVEGDPTKGWVVRPFHDLFYDKRGALRRGPSGGETTYERPILSLDEERRVVVILGTGDTDNFEKSDADNRIVSLTEVTSTASPTLPEDYHGLINWELRNEGAGGGSGRGLYPGELVTGAMALFEGQLFAATFISNSGGSDMCEYGRGRLWSLDYKLADKTHTYEVLNDFGIVETPVTHGPKLIDVPVESGVDSDASLFNIPRDRAEPNMLIQGLGTTQRNSCSPVDEDPLDSYFAPQLANIEQSQPPAIWVVAQASGGKQRGSSRLGGIQAKIQRRITFSRVTSWASSVD